MKTLTLTPNPAPISTDPESSERPQFVCPLTFKEINGVQPFVYISTCGCVFSQAGLRTVTSSASPKGKEKSVDEEEQDEKPLSLCPQCAKKYSATEDVIPINPSQEEEEIMFFALERKRLLEPTKKKSKKRKNVESPDEEAEPPTKKQVSPPVAAPSLNPSMAAASRAVVSGLAMEEAKRKAGMSEAVKSLYGDGTKKKETFMTMGTFTRVCLDYYSYAVIRCLILSLFFFPNRFSMHNKVSYCCCCKYYSPNHLYFVILLDI